MLMPIVSMNKMAMNESVAATCCYHEVASPTNVFWEVLHGGWIGAGYVDVLGWWSSSYKDWTALAYDVKGVKNDNGTYNALPKIAKTTVPQADGTTLTQWDVYDPNLGWVELCDFFKLDNPFSQGALCTHDSQECAYRFQEVQHLPNQHFQSTSAHKTADNWKVPHDAKQFNS